MERLPLAILPFIHTGKGSKLLLGQLLHRGGLHSASQSDFLTLRELSLAPVVEPVHTRHRIGCDMLRDHTGLFHSLPSCRRVCNDDLFNVLCIVPDGPLIEAVLYLSIRNVFTGAKCLGK